MNEPRHEGPPPTDRETWLAAQRMIYVLQCHVAIEHQDRLLLVRYGPASAARPPSFPGGTPAPGETLAEAAERIGGKAAGFAIEATGVICIERMVWDEERRTHLFFNFWARPRQGVEGPLPEGTAERAWRTRAELEKMVRSDSETRRSFGGPHSLVLARQVLRGERHPLSVLG